jgi:hypothetical protein
MPDANTEVLAESITYMVLCLVAAAIGFGFFWRDLRRIVQRRRDGESWWAVLFHNKTEQKL